MKKILGMLIWVVIAALGAGAYATLALKRSEPVSSIYILLAAVCTYTIGYRFYSKWIAASVLALNDRRATPPVVHEDGKDFVKTNKWIVFGHHFAAISGPGPLVGPVLAAQFGYLPGTLWILIGVVLGGAVQDFVVLFASMRRDGKSLGQMVKEELNGVTGAIALVAILAIMVILLAVLGLVVVKALAHSPWGVFTVAATIPIAMLMGSYMRYIRPGKVLEASIIGVVLLLLSVLGGQWVHEHATWSKILTFSEWQLGWGIILYGLVASVVPVWLLLAPRDYLSTFMKLGTIFALALGVFILLPKLSMPAVTPFIDGSGPVVSGKLFPFCFITIACGAISGFHTLIASGTTPKLIAREKHARSVGYGAMCLESLVAIMALIAACTLDPGVYLSMNISGTGATPQAIEASIVAKVHAAGFSVEASNMHQLASDIGENTLFGRTGGAATLAVGMAKIFSSLFGTKWLALWYHFAIMFEALFILTTLDAGTRVGRYLLQDFLGHLWKPLGDTRRLDSNLVASALMVSGWGYFLLQGVRDPLGGINSLWPLFGIANQLLAAIALCLATTILLKMHQQHSSQPIELQPTRRRRIYALVTVVPLAWLLAVTLTAGYQKIFHEEQDPKRPRIGFLQLAAELKEKRPSLVTAVETARLVGGEALEEAEKNLRKNKVLWFNNVLDATVAGTFMLLVLAVVFSSVRQWIRLCRTADKRITPLKETPPQWLSAAEMAPAQGPRTPWAWLGLGVLLMRELTDEAAFDRAKKAHMVDCRSDVVGAQGPCVVSPGSGDTYIRVVEERRRGVTRCC